MRRSDLLDDKDQQPVVKVHSWDFDGMLCDKQYFVEMREMIRKAGDENRGLTHGDFKDLASKMIENHQEFFGDRFGHETNSNVQNIIMIGSNRQNTVIDVKNSMKIKKDSQVSLSCYPFYAALAEVLAEKYEKDNIILDKSLLEDVLRDQRLGDTFDQVCRATYGLNGVFFQKLDKLMDEAAGFDANDKSLERKNHAGEIAAFEKFYQQEMYKNAGNVEDALSQYTDEKKMIALSFQMKHVTEKYGNEKRKFLFHFCDDKPSILKDIKDSIMSKYSEPAAIKKREIFVESTDPKVDPKDILPSNLIFKTQLYRPKGSPDITELNPKEFEKTFEGVHEESKYNRKSGLQKTEAAAIVKICLVEGQGDQKFENIKAKCDAAYINRSKACLLLGLQVSEINLDQSDDFCKSSKSVLDELINSKNLHQESSGILDKMKAVATAYVKYEDDMKSTQSDKSLHAESKGFFGIFKKQNKLEVTKTPFYKLCEKISMMNPYNPDTAPLALPNMYEKKQKEDYHRKYKG